MRQRCAAEIAAPKVTVEHEPITGERLSIGQGFRALSFKHARFSGLMDPLVMVDHYFMSEPTFGAHAHAGMSAVTVLFEDSVGLFNNRDSMGNDIDLEPGDLYWLKAGSGALHDEKPTPGSRTHGLQMFVNLPARLKHDAPEALHVKAVDMPQIVRSDAKVRLVLGRSNGLVGASSPALPLTILDAMINVGGEFEHEVALGHSQWIHVVKGSVEILDGERLITIHSGEAFSVGGKPEPVTLVLRASSESQVVVVTGEPIKEAFVQRGPFVMTTEDEIEQVEAAYRSGRLGGLSD